MSEIKILYDGRYPNLCSGNLIVIVDGKEWKFPEYCLSSGGGISGDWENVYSGAWTISEWPDNFPENLKQSVLESVNDEIPSGCCGGCI